jgi:nucleotide-binding universal stress UspA family protein
MEVALHNILVATDFSPTSEKALQYAVAIASRYDSKIHLVHVIQPTAIEFLQPAAMPEAYERLRGAAEEALKKEAEQLPDVRRRVHLMSGTAIECVEGIVREEHIDLVVVGTHAPKGLKKFVLGSAAEGIIRSATCPVLTVGPNAPEIDVARGLNCILFPTDLVSDESGALAYAISLAQRHNARLLVLYVMSGVQPPPPDSKEVFEKPYLDRLRRIIPADVKLPYAAECQIEYRDPAPNVILRVAGERAADLIVLSVRPEEAWARRLTDKTYPIVAGSMCPVLTVREKESA